MNIYYSTIKSLIVLALSMSISVLYGQEVAFFNLTPVPASVEVGDQVCIEFEAQNFGDLTSVQFGLTYDEGVLSFTSAESSQLPGFTSSNYSSNGSGLFTFSYEPSVSEYPNGFEIQDGLNILQVCFEAIAVAENSELAVTSTPVPFEVYSNNQNLKTTLSSTFINVTETIDEDDCPFDGIKIIVDENCGDAGTNICVDVKADDFEDILSMQYSINYDPSALSFTHAEDFLLPGLTASNIANPFPGFITLSWTSNDLTEGTSLNGSEKIYELCFDIIETSTGSSTTYLSVGSTPTPVEVVSSSEGEVDIWRVDGKIQINNPDCENEGNPSGSLSFNISDYEVFSGDLVCIPITVSNFFSITNFQYSINYDASILGNPSIVFSGFPNLTTSNINILSPGAIGVSWDTADYLNGTTVTDNTILFELCFDVVGSEGSTDVTFTGNPVPIEVQNINNEFVNAEFNGGSVTVLDQNPGGVFTLEINDNSAENGDIVCLDVTASNFENVLSMQFSIDYDETALVFNSIQNINLDDLSPTNFGNPIFGSIPVSWTNISDLVNGATVSDGTSIFQICFDVIGDEGVYPIAFTNSPTPIEIVNALTLNLIDPINLINGEVEVGENIVGSNDLVLEISNESAEIGDNVCLDVTTSDFENILAMQFSIVYDATTLVFTGVDGINLPDCLPTNFGNSQAGVISLSWFSNSNLINGATVSDGTTLFQICFDVIGNEGIYPVEFSSIPTSIEIIDAVSQNPIIPYNLIDGEVEVGENNQNFKIDLSVESAAIGEEVCLDVNVYGFNQVVGMQYGIEFDTTELAFTGVSNMNLIELSSDNFSLPVENTIASSWFYAEVEDGTTLPDGTTIYQLCFEVLSDFEFSEVKFTDSYLPIEIVDSSISPIDYTLDDGGVNLVSFFNPDMGINMENKAKDELYQNKPNPAIESTIVSFNLSEAGSIQFDLYKENGVLVKSFSNKYEAGINEIQLDNLNEPGLYYYTISGQGFSLGKRMIVVAD